MVIQSINNMTGLAQFIQICVDGSGDCYALPSKTCCCSFLISISFFFFFNDQHVDWNFHECDTHCFEILPEKMYVSVYFKQNLIRGLEYILSAKAPDQKIFKSYTYNTKNYSDSSEQCRFCFIFLHQVFVTDSKKKYNFLKNSSHAGQCMCWQQNLCPRVYICILHRTIQCSMNKDKAYRREQRWSVQQQSQLVTSKSSPEWLLVSLAMPGFQVD